jgi:hypothetical protein
MSSENEQKPPVLTPEVVDESHTQSEDKHTQFEKETEPQATLVNPAPKQTKKRDFVTERKVRRTKARNTNFKKLNVQQQKFVLATIATNSPQQAVKEAGYVPAGGTSAVNNRAAALLSSPKVVNALEEKLNELYPNLRDKVSDRLDGLLSKRVMSKEAMKAFPDPDAITVEEFNATLDRLIRICGYEKPKVTGHLRANVTPGSYLPGSKK